MNITNVNVTRVNSDSKLEAMASVTIDNAIRINGFKVIDGEKGYFVAMPSRPDKNGEYRDTVYPVTPEARKQLIEAVLGGFTKDRLERENIPDLEDTKLPWDADPSVRELQNRPTAIPEPKPTGTKPLAKEQIISAKEKTSVREQLAELGKGGDMKEIKLEKAIKPKLKEEISL